MYFNHITTEDGQIRTRVTDIGTGITLDEIDQLFRVDVHLTKEGTEGEVGTGFGLILCKEYIIKNKGKIWVESELDKGSTFHFTLPQNKDQL